MTSYAVSAADVFSNRVGLHPIASCAMCPWSSPYDPSAHNLARIHVRINPTHTVRVSVMEITDYYVPTKIG